MNEWVPCGYMKVTTVPRKTNLLFHKEAFDTKFLIHTFKFCDVKISVYMSWKAVCIFGHNMDRELYIQFDTRNNSVSVDRHTQI